MAGSVAEERIREKVEAALRRRRPDARIIHELVLRQGAERIDLAAVWDDGMILAEIKSERDKLSRLQAQLKAAGAVGCEVWLCVAEKWRAPLLAMSQATVNHRRVPLSPDDPECRRGYSMESDPNPAFLPELVAADILVRFETDDGLEPIRMHPLWQIKPRVLRGCALLNMLWADELRWLTGLGLRSCRTTCMEHAREHLTGREIRRGVCAALRAREFPRADEAVELPPSPALKGLVA